MKKSNLDNKYKIYDFTMVELMIVIGIILTLAALLFPALQLAKESARTTACASNMRQLGVAFGLYAAPNNSEIPWSMYKLDGADFGTTSQWEGLIFDTMSQEFKSEGEDFGNKKKYDFFRCPSDKFIGTSRSYGVAGSGYAKSTDKFSKTRIGAYVTKNMQIQIGTDPATGDPIYKKDNFTQVGSQKWGGYDTPYENFLILEAACYRPEGATREASIVDTGFGKSYFSVNDANLHLSNGTGGAAFGAIDTGAWAHRKKSGSNYLFIDLHNEFIGTPAKPIDEVSDNYNSLNDFKVKYPTWNKYIKGFDARNRKIKENPNFITHGLQ